MARKLHRAIPPCGGGSSIPLWCGGSLVSRLAFRVSRFASLDSRQKCRITKIVTRIVTPNITPLIRGVFLFYPRWGVAPLGGGGGVYTISTTTQNVSPNLN